MNWARTSTFSILIILLAGMMAGCGDENLSPTSMTGTAVVLDTAPPAIPTGLAAAPTGSMVKIRWEPNVTDLDLAGFLVYRLAFGNSYILTESPLQDNFYIDPAPLRTGCIYAVTAVDQDGNESPWQMVAYDSQPELPDLMDGVVGE